MTGLGFKESDPGNHWGCYPKGLTVDLDYCCHIHGVIRRASATDEDRLEACPICGGPIFVAPPELLD
jgi:hypothetical protein